MIYLVVALVCAVAGLIWRVSCEITSTNELAERLEEIQRVMREQPKLRVVVRGPDMTAKELLSCFAGCTLTQPVIRGVLQVLHDMEGIAMENAAVQGQDPVLTSQYVARGAALIEAQERVALLVKEIEEPGRK